MTQQARDLDPDFWPHTLSRLVRHEDLDADTDFQKEVGNAARALVEAVKLRRRGKLPQPDEALRAVRPK